MAILEHLLDFFYPRFCIYCKKPIHLPTQGYLCEQCFNEFVFNSDLCCALCGRDMGTYRGTICRNCTELNPCFHDGISLFAFNPMGRHFIHTLKYHNGVFLKHDLRKIFLHAKEKLSTLQQPCFVPVPLHFTRKWKRGYNQSLIIAQVLKQVCGGEIISALRRKINTPSQTSLTGPERKLNVKDAFVLNVKMLDLHKTYVLVDDVFTTGATLNECANVLCWHGVKDVRVFTLAHG